MSIPVILKELEAAAASVLRPSESLHVLLKATLKILNMAPWNQIITKKNHLKALTVLWIDYNNLQGNGFWH